MLTLAQTGFVIAFLCYWLYRGERLYREYTPKPEVQPELADVEPIPDDLIAYAGGFAHDWAKQQTLDSINELRSKLGDYDKVRKSLGLVTGTM